MINPDTMNFVVTVNFLCILVKSLLHWVHVLNKYLGKALVLV